MDTFTVRDLRERTGELIRDAEAGKLSIVTKHGRPVFVAVPFDETIIKSGLPLALAIRLFEEEVVSLGAAAKLAGITVAGMIDELGARAIPVVRYSQTDLDEELSQVAALTRR